MSGFYTIIKEKLLARTVPQASEVFILGVNDDYVFDASHTDLTATVGLELLPEQQLAGVTFTGGVLDANDVTWVAAGAGVEDRSLVLKAAIIYFKDGSTPIPCAYIDSASVGLPQTITGVDVTAQFDPRGILKL